MKRYEYRVEQKSVFKTDKSKYNKEITEKLSVLGNEGWELASL